MNSTAPTTATHYVNPEARLSEDANQYVLEAFVPGVSKENVEVSVENGELTLVATRSTTPDFGKALHRESHDHSFRRVFQVDPSVDVSRITARVSDGVATLVLPKAESQKPRRITVGD